jgi:hypothetical protein
MATPAGSFFIDSERFLMGIGRTPDKTEARREETAGMRIRAEALA